VTDKGQGTIPKHVREAMKITPGTKVAIELAGDDEAIRARCGRLQQVPTDSSALWAQLKS
jgi:AbrB family looped-hinge helix DNA binding protein